MAQETQLALINIREENGKQTVSARELHEKLEVKTDFNNWLKRMLDFGFVEGEDFLSILTESTGGRPAMEYYISIDMAKEICMIQRSEIGRKFRQYFIECEKRLIESNRRAMPQTYIEAIESLLNELKKNQALEEKGKLLLEQKEKAEAETERIIQYNKNFHSHLYTATDLAKMLGTNPYRIGKIANEHHLKQEPLYGKLGKIQLNNGRWVEIFYYNEDAKLVIENNL